MFNPKEFPSKKNHIVIEKRNKKLFTDNFTIGSYALISLESKYIYPKELESVRKLIVRYIRKNNSILLNKPIFFFRVLPYLSLTTKPKAVRMGKGKGDHSDWVYPILVGKFFIEIKNFTNVLSYELLKKIQSKISVKTKIIIKRDISW